MIVFIIVVLPIRLAVSISIVESQPTAIKMFLYGLIPLVIARAWITDKGIQLRGSINKVYLYSQFTLPDKQQLALMKSITIKRVDINRQVSILNSNLYLNQVQALTGNIISITTPKNIHINTEYWLGNDSYTVRLVIQTSIAKVVLSLIRGAI